MSDAASAPPITMEAIAACMSTMDLQRNFHISLKHRYVYIAVPKAANSTIKGLLQQAELWGTNFSVRDVHDRLASPLLAPFQLEQRRFLEILGLDTFTRFTCVRDPYARLLSCYLDRVTAADSVPRQQIAGVLGREPTEPIGFPDFIHALSQLGHRSMNEHFRPQYLLTCVGFVPYDHILKFESLDRGLPQLLEALFGVRAHRLDPGLNLSPMSTGASAQLHEHLTPELVRVINEVYHRDFEIFGYSRR